MTITRVVQRWFKRNGTEADEVTCDFDASVPEVISAFSRVKGFPQKAVVSLRAQGYAYFRDPGSKEKTCVYVFEVDSAEYDERYN